MRFTGREGVYRWLFGLTGDRQAAEDLAQEVFLKAWTAMPSLQQAGGFRGWLFRIARNCFADSLRSARSPSWQPLPEAALSRESSPADAALERECDGLLQEACARLPVDYRAALLLWTQERFSYAEIAQALNTTEETARWRVFKARHMLLRRLGAYLDPKKP
jgi:RNA polymerase sigma-70 factor (ECF subfamily)